MTIKPSEWVWYGLPGHFCGSHECRFHLTTKVGPWLVSTVGAYFPRGIKSVPEGGVEIGYKRKFETMVFRIDGVCDCGCGQPEIVPTELFLIGYNDSVSANAGHLAACREWSKKDLDALIVEEVRRVL